MPYPFLLKDDLVAVKEEFAGYIPTLLSRNTGNCNTIGEALYKTMPKSFSENEVAAPVKGL